MTETRHVVHEGWRCAWPDETCVVWLDVPVRPTEPIVAFAEYRQRGEPAQHARAVKRIRAQHHLVPARLFSWCQPLKGPDDVRHWPSEYARVGVMLGTCDMGAVPEIRAQRLARELERRVLVGIDPQERKLVPALRFHQRAAETLKLARTTLPEVFGTPAEPALVEALTYALMPAAELWPVQPEEEELLEGAIKPRLRPESHEPDYWQRLAEREESSLAIYGDPWWN